MYWPRTHETEREKFGHCSANCCRIGRVLTTDVVLESCAMMRCCKYAQFKYATHMAAEAQKESRETPDTRRIKRPLQDPDRYRDGSSWIEGWRWSAIVVSILTLK